MKYVLINRNKSVTAKNNEDFVRWMRLHDMQIWEDDKDFMRGYAYRKFTFEKISIRTESVDAFVEDLQKNNLLKIESSKGFLGLF